MKLRSLIVLVMVVLTLGGCRTAPVRDIVDAPVIATKESYTLGDVEKAIIRAGAQLGWQMKPAAPGHIVGTLNIRDHMAQVDVRYNRQHYSITYKDSRNLDYEDGTIHNNYNGWVQNLDRAINIQISLI